LHADPCNKPSSVAAQVLKPAQSVSNAAFKIVTILPVVAAKIPS
jgi:hypothetical protein